MSTPDDCGISFLDALACEGPRDVPPTAREVYDAKMAQVIQLKRAKPKGRHQTPSLEQLYGALIRAGQVRIIRKKGRAPVVEWL